MISKVVLAKLSPTMDEGTIVSWEKAEGDTIKVGDVVAVIETDKANMEMEALGNGVLRTILMPAGAKVPVGALIGVIADPGDDIAAVLAEAAPAAPPETAPAQSPQAAPTEPQPSTEPVRVKASPLARRMAVDQSVPLQTVPGSGPGGRIVKRDIEAFVGAPAAAPPLRPAAPRAAEPVPAADRRVALTGMRKTIARRLTESKLQTPHYYVTFEIDMDRAVALREQLVAAQEEKVSFGDFVIRACAKALTRFPAVNASWNADAIAMHGDVHVGVAVALDDGLVTPVVRDADRKGLLEIAREVRELAARARQRALRPEEYTGGTFTVSNLGMFGVDEFTAIINPPEGAILAVGAIRRVPVVAGETVRPGHRMKVTLSADHRLIDGAVAAGFLQEVQRLLENPIAIVL